MKKLLSTLVTLVLFSASLLAQSPQGFNYQMVVRNGSGQLLTNRTVAIQLEIRQGSETGTAVYQYANSVTTNANGLATLVVGAGSTEYASIPWSDGPFYLAVSVDLGDGSGYSLSSVQQILSVPYAQYAEMANSLSATFTYNEKDPLFTRWGYLYDSLVNAPTRLSQFVNDLNFINADSLSIAFNGDTLVVNGDNVVVLPDIRAAYVEWDSIRNRPTGVSAFINDAGYLTTENQTLANVLDKGNDAGGRRITGLGAPSAAGDAANKGYVDARETYLNSRIDTLVQRVDSLSGMLAATDSLLARQADSLNRRIDSLARRVFQLEHPHIDGSLHGIFSISASKQIQFSQGNLQYRPRINSWRFAPHQYDYAGADNQYVTQLATCNVWIDLFGYGTSGWDRGAARFLPYETNTNNNEYNASNSGDDLTGDYANADWGYRNPIINGGNQSGIWRTLTNTEWTYLLQQRPNAAQLQGLATVVNMHGLVLLPDNWVCPTGISFNSTATNYSSNTYDATVWQIMEEAGAVFLPAAGYRMGSTFTSGGNEGYYWSTTHFDRYSSHAVLFNTTGGSGMSHTACSQACSVRLIHEY